jgi:hypothetical protein
MFFLWDQQTPIDSEPSCLLTLVVFYEGHLLRTAQKGANMFKSSGLSL